MPVLNNVTLFKLCVLLYTLMNLRYISALSHFRCVSQIFAFLTCNTKRIFTILDEYDIYFIKCKDLEQCPTQSAKILRAYGYDIV